MPKIYSAVQRVVVPGGIAYAHVGQDIAFLKNSKLTAHKRALQAEVGADLTNWSYKVDGNPVPGQKVYTIQRKVSINGQSVYIQAGPDTGYLTLTEASKALRGLGGGKNGTDKSLVIWSFVVDGPQDKDFDVTVRVTARTQEQAERIAAEALAAFERRQ